MFGFIHRMNSLSNRLSKLIGTETYCNSRVSSYARPGAPQQAQPVPRNARVFLNNLPRNLSYNIQDKFDPNIFTSSAVINSNIELSDIRLQVGDQNLVLNLTWLRDSCHCNLCTHEHSRQRLFTAKDFRKDLFSIKTVKVVDQVPGGVLNLQPPPEFESNRWLKVEWGDDHVSIYPLGWLIYVNSLYRESQIRTDRRFHPKFKYPQDDFYSPKKEDTVSIQQWNVSKIKSSLQPVDFNDLIDGFVFKDEPTFINANQLDRMSERRFESILSLTQQLTTYGLSKIINVPQERNQVLRVARSLAYERPTGYGTVFDVVVEPSEEINLAYSSLEFDIHSDLTYREISPGAQLLHCIRNSSEGGLSYFSDALYAAELLKTTHPELFEVLVQFPVTFVVKDPYRNIKFRRHQPIISLDLLGAVSDIYYSPFMLPPVGFVEDVKLFYLAFDKLTQLLQSRENKFISKMAPGDLFIFNNRRVLHGRSAYDPKTSSRFLQGCYMDWDEVRGLHEKLSHHNSTESR